MYTEFGKFLRHLRLENYENMKDMAEKIGISISFLSAVELGKKQIPSNWVDKITNAYSLSEDEANKLIDSYNISKKNIEIDTTLLSIDQKETASLFARSIKNVKPDTLEKLRELLEEQK